MTLVALALVTLLAVVLSIFTGLLRSLQRSHSRERDKLIDQVMHLSGKTWTPPPADEWKPPSDGEPLVKYTASPEQQPYQ